MQKVVLAVVVFTCLPALLYAAGRGGRGGKSGEHGGGHGEGNHRCGQWTNGQCVPSNNATCGAGHMIKTRTGDNCPVKEKSVSCNLPCPTAGAAAESSTVGPAAVAPGRRGKGGRKVSKRCDYIKGEWSQCDSNNQRTRTLTLNTAAGEQPAHCRQTKTIKKRCPKNRGNRGGGRGEGRNRASGNNNQ